MQVFSDKINALSTTEQRTLYVSYTELKTYRNKLDYNHAVQPSYVTSLESITIATELIEIINKLTQHE